MMNVKELKEYLAQWPDEMQVKLFLQDRDVITPKEKVGLRQTGKLLEAKNYSVCVGEWDRKRHVSIYSELDDYSEY